MSEQIRCAFAALLRISHIVSQVRAGKEYRTGFGQIERIDRAGIGGYYADHLDQATEVPDPVPLAQPIENRPYPSGP